MTIPPKEKEKPKVVTKPTMSKLQMEEAIGKIIQGMGIYIPETQRMAKDIEQLKQNNNLMIGTINWLARIRWWQVWRKGYITSWRKIKADVPDETDENKGDETPAGQSTSNS